MIIIDSLTSTSTLHQGAPPAACGCPLPGSPGSTSSAREKDSFSGTYDNDHPSSARSLDHDGSEVSLRALRLVRAVGAYALSSPPSGR